MAPGAHRQAHPTWEACGPSYGGGYSRSHRPARTIAMQPGIGLLGRKDQIAEQIRDPAACERKRGEALFLI